MNTRKNANAQGEESDDYLLELIGIKEDFPKEALDAYGKLYERFWEIMYSIALNICRYSREKDKDAEDLVADTFNIIYHKKASSFNKDKISRNNVRISIISWMKTIMLSIYYDCYIDDFTKEKIQEEKLRSKEADNQEVYIMTDIPARIILNRFLEDIHQDVIEEMENLESYEQTDEDEKTSKNGNLISKYLDDLSEREKDIVNTIYSFYVPGKNTPSEVLDLLQERWGTTRDNIRRIMKHFRDKIKVELSSKVEIRR